LDTFCALSSRRNRLVYMAEGANPRARRASYNNLVHVLAAASKRSPHHAGDRARAAAGCLNSRHKIVSITEFSLPNRGKCYYAARGMGLKPRPRHCRHARAARGIAPKCPRVHTSAVALSFQRYPFTATLHSIPSANQELNSSPPSAESVALSLSTFLSVALS
jgi:hypothetical protein